MRHKLIIFLITLLCISLSSWSNSKLWAQGNTTELLDEHDTRIEKLERKIAMDRINFKGDYRFQVHNIEATVDPFYNGMMLQNGVIGAMFYMQTNSGSFPPAINTWEAIQSNIRDHYADYLYFTKQLTFKDLKSQMSQFPATQQQQLMGMLLPGTKSNGYDYENKPLYTNRVRLYFNSEISSKLDFHGRLSMYKAWGDSTGVQVFNGQPSSINIDGTTAHVPNSDILRVERAFFSWDIGDSPAYLSVGRRPATGGPPLHIRQGSEVEGTPMGTLVDYQFDGITLGCRLEEYIDSLGAFLGDLGHNRSGNSSEKTLLPGNTFRLCYGVGYDSGFGNTVNNGLEDTTMYGFDWDLYNDDDMFIQVMYVKAKDVTDGFNGLVVLPLNPLTGDSDNSNHIMRYTPSQNLGDLNLSGIVLVRHNDFYHYFLSWSHLSSAPENITTPFGGLFCDPFEKPESQSATMLYAGGRVDLDILNGLMIGLEYNQGSKYWFNFTQAADDIFSPKLATRGSVWELYSIFKINKWADVRLSWQEYDYDYSGSGWHMGTPKDLSNEPILGFPACKSARVISLATNIRF